MIFCKDSSVINSPSCPLGLSSCTESLGCESSDEISSIDDQGADDCKLCRDDERNYDDPSSSFSPPLSFSVCWNSRREKRCWERKSFPPPLTTLSEKGRRNFVLRSARNDGRLEIVAEVIERPEILYATRENGRLRLQFFRDVVEEEVEEEEEENVEESETEEEEKEDVVEEDEKEREIEGDRDWKVAATTTTTVAAGLPKRCSYHQELNLWGQKQHMCVPTM